MNTQTSTATNRQRPRVKVIKSQSIKKGHVLLNKSEASSQNQVSRKTANITNTPNRHREIVKLLSATPKRPVVTSKPAIRKKAVVKRVLPAVLASSPTVRLQKRIPARVKTGSNDSLRSLGIQLFSDINDIFKTAKVYQLRTQSILDALNAVARKPWATFHNGNPIVARQLASLLKPFGIRPQDIRFSGSAYKGYKKEWFI